jgi:hypothetical protein
MSKAAKSRRNILIEDELWEAAKDAANGESVSAWIRTLIRKALGK